MKICFYLTYSSKYVFIYSLPVYRWMFTKVHKTKNRNCLSTGEEDLKGRQWTNQLGHRACKT